jgi:hypothetical protein
MTSVNSSVDAESTERFSPFGATFSGVSSNPTTVSPAIRSSISATDSSTASAPSASSACSQPTKTATPHSSTSASRVRSTGRCWRTRRYNASARSSGPSDTGAVDTPSGRAATGGHPQPHTTR